MNRRTFLTKSAMSGVAASLSGLAQGPEGTRERTPAAAAKPEPFAFAVVADPHCAEKPGHGWPEAAHGTHMDRFRRCVEEMEQLGTGAKPEFMLIVGDIHLWELRKHLDRVSIPMHLIAGNHETGKRKAEIRELFPQDFSIDGKPSDYYSFTHKGVRFIGVCDAGRGGEHIGQLCSEDFRPRGQCEWLERELQKAEAQKVVFAHIPPHPRNTDLNMYMSRNDSMYFNELVRKTQPTAAFFGHQHRATSEYRIGRTRLVTARSCAWNSAAAPLGFLIVNLTEAGIKTREVITGAPA